MSQEDKQLRHDLMLRTFGYEREYREAERELVTLKREARLNGGFYREPDAKVIFAIRLKGYVFSRVRGGTERLPLLLLLL